MKTQSNSQQDNIKAVLRSSLPAIAVLAVVVIPLIRTVFPIFGALFEDTHPPPHLVRAVKDIAAGEIISNSSLQDEVVEVSKIPIGAVTRRSLVAGNIAEHAISRGQVIHQDDIRRFYAQQAK